MSFDQKCSRCALKFDTEGGTKPVLTDCPRGGDHKLEDIAGAAAAAVDVKALLSEALQEVVVPMFEDLSVQVSNVDYSVDRVRNELHDPHARISHTPASPTFRDETKAARGVQPIKCMITAIPNQQLPPPFKFPDDNSVKTAHIYATSGGASVNLDHYGLKPATITSAAANGLFLAYNIEEQFDLKNLSFIPNEHGVYTMRIWPTANDAHDPRNLPITPLAQHSATLIGSFENAPLRFGKPPMRRLLYIQSFHAWRRATQQGWTRSPPPQLEGTVTPDASWDNSEFVQFVAKTFKREDWLDKPPMAKISLKSIIEQGLSRAGKGGAGDQISAAAGSNH